MARTVPKRFQGVRSLYEMLPKGAEGGKEFARIVDLLLFHEARRTGRKITIFSDAAGDYHGLDSFGGDAFRKYGTTGYQYKFYPSPLSSKHRTDIEKSLQHSAEAQEGLKLRKWILVTPHVVPGWNNTYRDIPSSDAKLRTLLVFTGLFFANIRLPELSMTVDQAVTSALGSNVAAKRAFEQQMAVLSVGATWPFLRLTLNGVMIALDERSAIYEWARALDLALDLDWALNLARDRAWVAAEHFWRIILSTPHVYSPILDKPLEKA